jgi:hypothetical protein
VRAIAPTFISVEQSKMAGYSVLASPTLYPSQRAHAVLAADARNRQPANCGLFIRHYNADDHLTLVPGPTISLAAGATGKLEWIIPPTDGQPIAQIGLEIFSNHPASATVYLDSLTWTGTPNVVLKKPAAGGTMWSRAWIDAMDQRLPWNPEIWIQNSGRGLWIQGTRDWRDYRVSMLITPHMVRCAGVAARVQGMRRYYALLLHRDGVARLVKMLGTEQTLAEAPFKWEFTQSYLLEISAHGNRIQASIDGKKLFDVDDRNHPIDTGAIAIVCEEGRGTNGPVTVMPR